MSCTSLWLTVSLIVVAQKLKTVSWRYISRLYMLVPVVTLLFFIGLDLLVTFAWSVPTVRPP